MSRHQTRLVHLLNGSLPYCRFLLRASVFTSLLVGTAAAAQDDEPVSLPRNVWTVPEVRAGLTDLIAKSATLQRQCERIAGASVYVVLRLTVSQELSGTGARTTFYRLASGFVLARVEVPAGEQFTELVAHEFEHVIEQIDGLNLPALAATQSGGVRRVGPGVYETERARAAGEAVVTEVYACPDPIVTAVGRNVARAVRLSWRTLKLAATTAHGAFGERKKPR